jgi:hypothetical protein
LDSKINQLFLLKTNSSFAPEYSNVVESLQNKNKIFGYI